MWDWLDRVRQKPKPVRDQYAFFGAATLTAVVALIWLVSLPTHFAKMGQAEAGPEQEAIGAFGQFFSEAKANLGNIISATFDAPATSTPTTTAPSTPGITIPELKTETIESVKQKDNNPTIGRPVLIETISSVQSSTTATDR